LIGEEEGLALFILDYDSLISTNKLFARKFSMQDTAIVDAIYNYVKNSSSF